MMQAVAAGDDASVLRHIDHRINQDALPASWVYFFSAAFFSAGALDGDFAIDVVGDHDVSVRCHFFNNLALWRSR